MNGATARESQFWQRWSTSIIVMLLVVLGLLLGWFVQRSVSQVRDALAEEVLQQQHDVANLLHEYAQVMLSIERARISPDTDNPSSDSSGTDTTSSDNTGADRIGSKTIGDIKSAIAATNKQLEKMRFQYSFERLDGAASAHAYVKPVLEDVEQWLDQGLSGLTPADPLVLQIAARRMGERYDSLRTIADDADQVAAALISEQTATLDRFRKTLLVMLALTFLSWLGIVASLVRQRNLQTRLRIDGQRHAQRIIDFADLGADLFWEIDKNQKMKLLHPPALLPAPAQHQGAVPDDQSETDTDGIDFIKRLPLPAIQSQSLFTQHELTWVSPDGGERLLTVSGKPLYGPHGEFQGFRGVGRDITQRKEFEREMEQLNHELLDAQKRGRQEAEQALRDSEQFLRNSLDALTANIAILDSNGCIVAINRAWNKFADTQNGEYMGGGIGAHYLDVFKSRPAAEHRAVTTCTEQIADVLSARSDDFYRELACHSPGQLNWFALHLTTFDSNLARYAVMVYENVTARKKLEQRDHRLRAQLAHTARLTTAGEMASGLAHELNQPLTAISHNCDALQYAVEAKTLSDPDLKDTLADIYEQAQRAGRIIHSMRQMVKKDTVTTTSVDINALVKDTVRLSHAEAYEHRIEVQLKLSDELPLIRMDAVQIQQVLLNLERNALESIRQGNVTLRRIVISTLLVDDEIRVSVQDTGPGLDPAIRKKLFTSFQTTKEHGMGMGLSISRTIVESHGGRLWVDSDDARGVTTFSFTLPVGSE